MRPFEVEREMLGKPFFLLYQLSTFYQNAYKSHYSSAALHNRAFQLCLSAVQTKGTSSLYFVLKATLAGNNPSRIQPGKVVCDNRSSSSNSADIPCPTDLLH